MSAFAPIDYGCPECGFDGPHPVLAVEGTGDRVRQVVECANSECGVEFEVER